MNKVGYVYIITNKKNGTLYVGVTNNLAKRIYEHKEKLVDGFTKQYGLDRLVYFESYETITNAIEREKQLKNWKRQWKVALIEKENKSWDDLYETIIC